MNEEEAIAILSTISGIREYMKDRRKGASHHVLANTRAGDVFLLVNAEAKGKTDLYDLLMAKTELNPFNCPRGALSHTARNGGIELETIKTYETIEPYTTRRDGKQLRVIAWLIKRLT